MNKRLSEVFNVKLRTVERIVTSKQVHTRHNLPDAGPDPRGPTREITREETAAVGSYLNQAPLDDCTAP
jgi:hypothetical protein